MIIVTNDGELANKIAHPSYQVNKIYTVRVAGNIQREQLAEIRQGVYLSDGKANVESIRVKKRHKQTTELEMILAEGKNREIRRVLARVGHKVLQLKRIAIGPVRLGELPEGAYRELTIAEVKALKRLTAEKTKPGTRRKSVKKKTSTGKTTRKGVKRLRVDAELSPAMHVGSPQARHESRHEGLLGVVRANRLRRRFG